MQKNVIVIHNVLRKKNNRTKFSTSLILKKIKKDNLKKIQKQKRIKKQKKKKKIFLKKKNM